MVPNLRVLKAELKKYLAQREEKCLVMFSEDLSCPAEVQDKI